MKYPKDIYRVPSIVLSIVGAYDLLRGFMHTFLLKWSAANFARFDMATVPERIKSFFLASSGFPIFSQALPFC